MTTNRAYGTLGLGSLLLTFSLTATACGGSAPNTVDVHDAGPHDSGSTSNGRNDAGPIVTADGGTTNEGGVEPAAHDDGGVHGTSTTVDDGGVPDASPSVDDGLQRAACEAKKKGFVWKDAECTCDTGLRRATAGDRCVDPKILGAWQTCVPTSSPSFTARVTTTIDESKWSITGTFHAGAGCGGNPVGSVDATSATYQIGAPLTAADGQPAREIDLVQDSTIRYSSYRSDGATMRVAAKTEGHDGTAPDRRMNGAFSETWTKQ